MKYPACIIPFGKADKTTDNQSFEVGPNQLCAQYEPDLMNGAPCVVQVFTKRMRDEECLAAASVVDACINTDR